MHVRTFALLYGVVFAAVGLAGFFPAFVTPYDLSEHPLMVEQGAAHLLGLFPVNVPHNLLHVGFGVWGLLAYRNTGSAIAYARVVAIVYALLMLLSLIPGLNSVAGLVPLHGNDIWAHALLAAGTAYFGFLWHGPPTPASGRAARPT